MGSATVQQCVDMIVFGVLVQIWYRAQPQAKQEAKSASDVIYRKTAPSRDDPKQNSSLLPIVVPSHLTGIFAKGIIAQVIVTDNINHGRHHIW